MMMPSAASCYSLPIVLLLVVLLDVFSVLDYASVNASVCVCRGLGRVTYNVANTLNFSHLPAEATRIALSAFLCRLSK